MEKDRVSAEAVRSDPASPTAPVLPTTNPAVEKSEAPASGLHPAVYVRYAYTAVTFTFCSLIFHCSVWIALSSSVIIFNKWILDTGKFRK